MTNAVSKQMTLVIAYPNGIRPSHNRVWADGQWQKVRTYGGWTIAQCYYNAARNKLIFGNHLTLVIGSLCLAGHWEYGGKNYKEADFAKKPLDSHAWLEDKEGRVYDFIFEEYADNARLWGKNPRFATNWEILAISKEELAEDGLIYSPAPMASQKSIAKRAVIAAQINGFTLEGGYYLQPLIDIAK